jgi:preprotein translocase subunit SecF
MFRTLLSLLLTGLLVQGLGTAPALAAQANNDAQAVEKIKLKIAKMGVGEKARVTIRTKDGKKIKGFISQAGSDDFTLRDRNSGEATTISYNDVMKVENNRGHSTARNLLIGVGIGVGALLVTLAIIFSSLDD